MNIDFSKGLYPAKVGSGFQMDGYYVWCGSCIKGEDGKYYLFASRWPIETGFPDGYMFHSEIVLTSTDSLDKPFQFEKVIFTKRDGNFWDSTMSHNPQIVKHGDEYLLFYIGSVDGKGETRKIGVAHSKSITDGWVRPDKPIELPENANNPAVIIKENDGIYMAFRDGKLKVSIAYAKSHTEPFTVLNYDIFPKGRVEDMYLFVNNGKFEIIAEDNEGAYTGLVGAGVHFVSDDCKNWETCEPLQVYDRTVEYTDGNVLQLQRRERPQLFFDNGKTYLFTTAKIDGPTRECGGKTWNMVQEYK